MTHGNRTIKARNILAGNKMRETNENDEHNKQESFTSTVAPRMREVREDLVSIVCNQTQHIFNQGLLNPAAS